MLDSGHIGCPPVSVRVQTKSAGQGRDDEVGESSDDADGNGLWNGRFGACSCRVQFDKSRRATIHLFRHHGQAHSRRCLSRHRRKIAGCQRPDEQRRGCKPIGAADGAWGCPFIGKNLRSGISAPPEGATAAGCQSRCRYAEADTEIALAFRLIWTQSVSWPRGPDCTARVSLHA